MVTSYTVALFFHLLGALAFVAGIVVAGTAFEVARRRDDPPGIAALLGLARAAIPLVGLGALLLLGFGLWLVHLGRFGYDAGWVSAALALFAVALVLGALGGQRPKRARRHAARLAEQGAPGDAELRRLLDDPVTRLTNYASSAIVLAILVLMVFKP